MDEGRADDGDSKLSSRGWRDGLASPQRLVAVLRSAACRLVDRKDLPASSIPGQVQGMRAADTGNEADIIHR